MDESQPVTVRLTTGQWATVVFALERARLESPQWHAHWGVREIVSSIYSSVMADNP